MLRKKGIKKFVTCDSLKGYRKRMSFHSLRVRSAYGAKQSVRVIQSRPIARNPNLESLGRTIDGATIQRSVTTKEAQPMSVENTAAQNVSTAIIKRKDAQWMRTGTRAGQR